MTSPCQAIRGAQDIGIGPEGFLLVVDVHGGQFDPHRFLDSVGPDGCGRAAFSRLGRSDQIVLVNGDVGLLERRPDGRPFAVIGFTIANERIAEMNILADPERLTRLDLSAVDR